MPDIFTKKKRSEVMSRIRSHGNRDTELALIKVFRQHRITGWRRQQRLRVEKLRVERQNPDISRRSASGSQLSAKDHQLTVRPDFVFPKLRLAVFVDGCFWHACPKHATKPKGNAAFWKQKLGRNVARDREQTRLLKKTGWRVLRIWEHELARKNEARLLARLRRASAAFTS